MAKKNDPSQYVVQAYKSPYTEQLFALDDKAEFEKHLREQVRRANAQARTLQAKENRTRIWVQLRTAATCIEDIPKLLNALPTELGAYYCKQAFFKDDDEKKNWKFTLTEQPKLGVQSITHTSPLGQPHNWGFGNPGKPKSLLGLRGKANENLNYEFREAQNESGLSATNSEFVLFADDWPFVAKLALIGTFEKTLQVPEKTAPYYGANTISPDYIRFWEDIDRYSQTYVGMSYKELQGMRDTLGLTGSDLKNMMASYAVHGSNPPAATMTLILPEGVADIAMPGLGV